MMDHLSILILAAHPVESASTRYRIVQYIPYLKSCGINARVYTFLSPKNYRLIYGKGKFLIKFSALIFALYQLCINLLNVRKYDGVFISREIINAGPPFFEYIISRIIKIPVIYDLDDALWIPYESPSLKGYTGLLKSKSKIDKILTYAKSVIVCNSYLRDYTLSYNTNVTIIPTVLDTKQYQHYKLMNYRANKIPVIGWIGSHSTTQYLELIVDVLKAIALKHQFVFKVVGAGRHLNIPGVNTLNVQWDLNTEIQEISSMDIGVYPIFSNNWSIGKCAFKAIQYQAAGVACIASPVGMTQQVITHGLNGLLAFNEQDWYSSLDLLLADSGYRRRLVDAGYKNAQSYYSAEQYAPVLKQVIYNAVSI